MIFNKFSQGYNEAGDCWCPCPFNKLMVITNVCASFIRWYGNDFTLKLGLLELDSFAGWVDMGVKLLSSLCVQHRIFPLPFWSSQPFGYSLLTFPSNIVKNKKVKFQRNKTGFCTGRVWDNVWFHPPRIKGNTESCSPRFASLSGEYNFFISGTRIWWGDG